MHTHVKRARCVLQPEFTKPQIEKPSMDLILKFMEFGNGVSEFVMADVDISRKERISVADLYFEIKHVLIGPELSQPDPRRHAITFIKAFHFGFQCLVLRYKFCFVVT